MLNFAFPVLVLAAPPVAPVRDVVDTHFGVVVHDPYRYMEDLKNPEVQSWIRAQADYTAATLATIPGRDELLARIKELEQGAPFRIFGIERTAAGSMYYSKMMASENISKFYFRESETAPEKLLIDPDHFKGPKGEHATLSFTQRSPDAKHVVFGIALAGSEQTTLHILDVATGKPLPETIDRIEAEYTTPHWLPDSSGIIYARRQKLAPGAPPTEVFKLSRSFLHTLGTDVNDDREVFGKYSSPDVPMDDADFPSVIIRKECAFAIGKIKHGDANEITLYSTGLDSIGKPNTKWTRICDVGEDVSDFTVHGDWIYLVTAKDAPRFKVVRTSLKNPDSANAEVIVPASEHVVDGISAAKDALYVTLMTGGLHNVVRIGYEPGAKPEAIAMPDGAHSMSVESANEELDGVNVHTASWIKAGQSYAYDPAKKTLTKSTIQPRGKFDDPDGLEEVEVMVPSHDGVMVPLSIVYKRGIAMDGSHPTLLGGYGAYGFSQNIHFNSTGLAWVERGGIFATAHVRGGGEFGKEWHLAGQMLTKPNTWKDFNACAQYLIDKKYTSPKKLAGQGGSAGGILIGRAVTERPDLYGAAIISVGCEDMVRMETTTNGVPNIQEFGTVTTEDGFKGLLAMSAYHHVVDGTKYPAIMLAHGINDPRVEPWMSAKMTARLQAATASGKPVLFRVDYEAGHGIGSRRDQRQQQQADEWAFLMWQFGEKEFQPGK